MTNKNGKETWQRRMAKENENEYSKFFKILWKRKAEVEHLY